MGANSSPPAPDTTLGAATKKRKTSDAPTPVSLVVATDAASDGITANDIVESLHTEATLERIATAMELSHSLLNRALLDPTLPKSTSLAMEDSRSRLESLSALVDTLRSADIESVSKQLQRLFGSDAGVFSTLRDAADRAMTEANNSNNAAEITRTRRISSATVPPQPQPTDSNTSNNDAARTNAEETPTTTTTNIPSADANANKSNEPEDVNMEAGENDQQPRGSGNEEAAAAALTGLRLSSTASASAAAAAAAAVTAVAASGLPLPSPRPTKSTVPTGAALPTLVAPAPAPQAPLMLPVASPTPRQLPPTMPASMPYNATPLPSLSPTHAQLSIFAPQSTEMPAFSPHNGGPLFVSAPHAPVGSPLSTPGALPSIFARGLLAPIVSPYDPSKNDFHAFVSSPMVTGGTPLGTPLLTPHGQHLASFVDWKSLVPTPQAATPSESTPTAPEPTAAVTTPSTQSMGGQPGANESTGQASPIKRKSITAKQLVAAAVHHGASLTLPIAKSLAALERTHPTRKANPRRWTKEEDDALRTAVENHKEKNWKAIAAQVPGRNHTQCLQRWTKVLAPGLVKGHWSPHEDELLKRLVAGGNKNWGEVAAKIPGRTSKQCRERWHNHLDPNIVRGAYTPEEDRIILEAQARLGNRWSVIAAMLPGRTEDAVKIRWKSHCRLWKARKYLRKTATAGENAAGEDAGGPVDDANGDMDSSDDEANNNEEESPRAVPTAA